MIESFKLPNITPETVSGSVCNFTDEYGGLPLKSCVSQISGYQEGSGTPSPSNERPLHAFDSASLGKCDNNTALLWSIDNSFNGDVEFNQLVPTENKDYTNNYTDAREYLFFQIISITSPAQNYFYESVRSIGNLKRIFKTSTVTQGIRIKHNGSSRDLIIYESLTETLSDNSVYLVDVVCDGINPTVVGGIDLKNLQFFNLTQMFGSTIADYIYNLETQTAGAGVAFFKALYPNDYYPYNAGTKQLIGDTLATFTFGQSIYQGSIDWKRGVVVGTWSGKVDMGLLNWGYNSSFQAFYISLPNMYIPTTGQERLQGIANEVYPISTVDAISLMDDKSCLRYNGYLWTKDSDYTDRDDFKNSLIGKYVAYELATPIEIPLGGINLLTQQGQNNIYCDTGDTEVKWLHVN